LFPPASGRPSIISLARCLAAKERNQTERDAKIGRAPENGQNGEGEIDQAQPSDAQSLADVDREGPMPLLEHRGHLPSVHQTTRVASTAIVCGEVTIGPNCSIGFGAVLVAESGPVRIGANCVIMDTAVLRGVRDAPLTLGDNVLVGPRAYLTGCTVEDEAFLATGCTVFNLARIGRGAEVRINGIVHIRTVLPAFATVPLGWIAVGHPVQILAPDQHDAIWAVQKELHFPRTVFRVERAPEGQTIMPDVMPRYARALARWHAGDRVRGDDFGIDLTLIGGPTVLIEIAGLRLLTDPTFDGPGSYELPHVTLEKLAPPSLSADQIGRLDAVLLSHDQHADNLDHAGRTLLGRVPLVVTTETGAARLGGTARELAPWGTTSVTGPDGGQVQITATPARHGPAGIEPLSGPVIGFLIGVREPGDAIYVTGDTVWFDGVAEVARRFQPRVVVLFAGAAKTRGAMHLTMTVNDAIETAHAFPEARIVAVHNDSWAHFSETRADLERAFATLGMADRLVRLTPGAAVRVG
jgi:carbonic anhydrase/acetyltransferase-like protein (isoleucine patch superfamily)/L-ascorbate metabolism protein UlaG (beta-lactamase superfamily)